MNFITGVTKVNLPKEGATWMHGAAILTAWWPVLAFVIWSVYQRVQVKYFDGLLLASEIVDSPSFQDVLYLYREDLLIFGVAVPVLTAFLFVKLKYSFATATSLIAIILTQILLYANLQSWGQVGQFLNWQSLQNSISFGFSNPEFIGEYIALDGLGKLLALLSFSILVVLLVRVLWMHVWSIRLWGAAGCLSVALCALLSLVGYSSSMRSAPISNSFVVNAIGALSDETSSATTPISESLLDSRFEALAKITQRDFQGPNFNVHRGSNLLIFVMETASIEFLDTRDGLPDHPVLLELKDKIHVANNHFTTFPASAEGVLSLLTGTYPPRAIYGTCLIDMPRLGKSLPGPISQLRAAGYETGIYAPYSSQVPADKTVFEASGFEKVVYGETQEGDEDADIRALRSLKRDIKEWAESEQTFAAAFLPQIGHGPWPAELGADVQSRGTNVAHVQLEWLSQIVELLRTHDLLNDTVILLTGDHGVRTTMEDPRVKAGMIDWYSFHVPMLLYAPRANYSAIDSELPSSHVDLSAELGELFGLAKLPSYQGIEFHHPERKFRRSFLMAGWYFGANGYRDQEEAAMHSDLLDAVYERSDQRVEFGIEQLVTDNNTRVSVREQILDMAALQEAWIPQRVCNEQRAPTQHEAIAGVQINNAG